MPVINVHSAASSGQLSPLVKAPGDDDGHLPGTFDRMLAGELREGGGTEAHDKAESAVASLDQAAAIGAAGGLQPGGDTPRLSSAPIPALIIGSSTAAATVGVGAPDRAISAAEGDEDRTVAVSAKPTPSAADAAAPDAAAPTPHPTIVATTIALGGGPLLGVAVTEGVTPVADEVVAAVRTEDSEAIATNDRRGEEQATKSGDRDGSTAETASASDTISAAGGVLIPLVAATHVGRAAAAAQAETSVRKGTSTSAPLEAEVPAGTNVVTGAAISPDGRSSLAKADDLSQKTSFTDAAGNTPAGAGAHHAGPPPLLQRFARRSRAGGSRRPDAVARHRAIRRGR